MQKAITVAAILALCSGVAITAVDDGLVAYYPFDEGAGAVASDKSGNGNDGKIIGRAKWGKGDWGAALTGYYISMQSEEIGDTTYSVNSHYEVGAQVYYNLPWNGTITLGAINLTNEGPEIPSGNLFQWEPFDWTLYDSRGRVVYIRYEQTL